jgi:YidC/Oxa1 family membrane protein insertase
MRKNMPESALTGQYAQQQKILLYVLPVVFAVGGIAFPIGVLLYWSTSNLWTMCQQFYVIRNNPTPGTPAFEAKRLRDLKKHEAPQPGGSTVVTAPPPEPPRQPPRAQPKKKTRDQRRQKPKPKPKPDAT